MVTAHCDHEANILEILMLIHNVSHIMSYLCIQAARGGNIEIIKILLDHGADIDARTEWGEGHSTLRVAMQFHDQESDIVQFLKLKGAQSIIPYPDEL